MKKRWISFLLVFVMMLSLLPLGVLAETVTPGVVTDPVNDDTGMNQTGGEPGAEVVPWGSGGAWEPGSEGDEDVAVLVYGEAMSKAIAKKSSAVTTFIDALKGSVQGILAGETIPDVEMYLVNDQLKTYKLTPNAVKDAAFLSSFRMKSGGAFGWLDDVFKWLEDGIGWLISDVDTIGDFYKIYGATDVPEGDYSLMVRSIGRDGYVLREPEKGIVRVHVGDDHVNYVGYEEFLGGNDFNFLGIINGYVDFYLPGVYLSTAEPALEFTSADVGGNALPGTEFLMVDRDETLNLVKAALTLGKDTFTNAMQEIDNGAFTWEELNILNYDLLKLDQEGQQINLDYEEAFKLIKTYWALLAAAGDEPLKEFMGTDTDIRIPAVLQTTADQNGLVRFSEDSNITLTWSVEVLLQMAHLVGKEIQDIDDHDIVNVMGNFEDSPILESILLMVIREAKELMVDGIEMWDDSGKAAKDIVNTYLYPILQNDHLLEYANWAMDLAKYVPFVDITIPDEIHKVMEYLPQHGLLTRKMPTGHYVMLETGVPDGYFHNPLFYTMELTWNTDAVGRPDQWCYCSVGNVGLIAPYFAEDYYKQLRELDLVDEADKMLDLITRGQTEKLFNTYYPVYDIIEGDADMTERALYMLAGTLYQVTGQPADQAKMVSTLLPYLHASGGTAQNMLRLCNKIIKTNKSVITDKITRDWKFYTPTTSIRTNAALKFKAFMQEVSGAIVTDDTINGKVNAAVKKTIETIVSRVDTKNYTEPYVTAVENAVKSRVSSILSSVLKKAVSTISKDIRIIAKGDPLPIFSWGKKN